MVYVCTVCGLHNSGYAGAILHERIGHAGYPIVVAVERH